MAVIEKRRGNWRVKVRKIGFSSASKTFHKRRDACNWALKIERDMCLGLFNNNSCTIRELLDRYAKEITPTKKCAPIENVRINRLKNSWLAGLQASEVNSQHIAVYRDERLKTVSAATCLREISLISHVFTIGMKEWNYNLTVNPATNVRKPIPQKGRDRRMENKEEEGLLRSCGESKNFWLLPLVGFAIETAMRRGELLSLEWKHVHIDQGYVHLPHTKNGEPRDVPLSSKSREILNDLPRDMSGLVFPLHFEALKSLWRRATQRAGIEDLHFHDLRHEATSRFFEKGLNIMEVSAITGHKDLRMLKRYTHLKAQDLAIKLG